MPGSALCPLLTLHCPCSKHNRMIMTLGFFMGFTSVTSCHVPPSVYLWPLDLLQHGAGRPAQPRAFPQMPARSFASAPG